MKHSLKNYLALALVLCSPCLQAADTAGTPKFDCTLTDTMNGDKPGEAKDAFTANTENIHFICTSSTVTKGQSVKADWVADDTNNAAPANYKIAEKSVNVPDALNDNQNFTANFALSKPGKGWPAGKYHVDLYVNDQLVQSAKFTVNKS